MHVYELEIEEQVIITNILSQVAELTCDTKEEVEETIENGINSKISDLDDAVLEYIELCKVNKKEREIDKLKPFLKKYFPSIIG